MSVFLSLMVINWIMRETVEGNNTGKVPDGLCTLHDFLLNLEIPHIPGGSCLSLY